MSLGIYGNVKLADVSADDIDIFYSYNETRETPGDIQLKPLFSQATNNDFIKMIGVDGAYKLRLPADIFNKIGFYSVIIKPKTFQTTIVDCSFVITNDANQTQISKKGIIIQASQFQKSNSLTGYQIEYFDKNNVKIKNLHRIITSSDLVSVSSNTNTVNQGSTNYTLNSNGNMLFLTVSPDEKTLLSNEQQDIGFKGQNILISNTFFNPEIMEIEMIDQNIKTLSYGIYGNSTRDLETGRYTIFDENGNIYKEYNLFTNKKQFSNGQIDVKEQRTVLDGSLDFTTLSNGG